jgi:hypothetical protein
MEEHKMSRRQVVTGLGTTLAAVAVSPVFGGTMMEKHTIDGAVKISDRRRCIPNRPLKASHNRGRPAKQNGPGTGLWGNQL